MRIPPGALSSQYELSLPHLMHRAVPYWVLDTGPLDDDGNYAYVIMGGDTGLTMWVLARNVEEFNELYDAEVHDKMEAMGYKNGGDRMPVATYQGDDCVYETSALGDGGNESFSHEGKVGLGIIIGVAVGIFLLAGVMFIKNWPGKSSTSGDGDEESMHLVTDITSFTNNPLAKAKSNSAVMEEGGENGL